MDSLPAVSQAAINAMNKKAEEMFGKDEEQYIAPVVERHTPMQLQSTMPTQFMNAQEDNAQEIREEIVQEDEAIDELDQPVKPETNREYNMRVMREELAREKREREMWQQRAMERQQPQEEYEEEEEREEETFLKKMNLEDDSLVEAKHLKELIRRDNEREKRQRQLEQEYRAEMSNMKVKNALPDFDKVCSNENFTMLRNMNPTLAQTIYNMPDSFEKKELAYSMVKQLGIYKDADKPKINTDDKVQALKNNAKPKVSAQVSPQQGESPLMRANAFANGRSKELDAIAIREMREAQMRS